MAKRRKIPGRSVVSNKYDKYLKRMVHDPENYKPSPWSDHWRNDLIDFGTEGHWLLKKINDEKLPGLKHRVWGLGDTTILDKPFIVAFTGRNWKVPPEEVEIGKEMVIRMAEMGIVVIHGNSKGVERASGRKLREKKGKQIIVPYYGMLQFKARYYSKMSYAVEHGHVLVLSPFTVFEPWRQRNTEKRNIFIADLADALIAVQVTDENGGGDLAKKMLARDKPVYLLHREGVEGYLAEDHEYFKQKGAKLFKLHQLDFILREIKEKVGYKT